MNLKRFAIALGLSSAILFSTMSFTSCTSKITEEQLAQLAELRKKENQLNQSITTKQSEATKLESEINSRQAVLNDCNKDKDFIKTKLSQWPNVWPDYNPNN
jgi:peptidoglycan hydrolase CwlO-like protein